MEWKRSMLWLLVLALVLAACGASSVAANGESEAQGFAKTAAEAFSDVAADDEYAESVGWCLENGLMNGVSDAQFDPDGTLTRGMLVTILYRAEKEPAVSGVPAFTDAEANVWYSNAVVWAESKNIIQGYGNGLFGIADPVSVEQLEVIIGRYTGDGPEWMGDPERAQAATRAQAAMALYGALKQEALSPEPTPTPASVPTPVPSPASGGANTLVAYFSATNTTRPLAEYAADILDADLFEIRPDMPYSKADLAYYTDCRADREQSDPTARPAIAADCAVANMTDYDVVFIGYPIWHGQAPRIIYTFLESYDFAGKTIVPFCTSGSSGIGSSAANLHGLTNNANWLAGKRFGAGTSKETVKEWIDTLELPKQEESSMNQITLSFNGHTYTAALEDNSTAEAFAELLKSKGGSMTIHMSEYGGWEKVGPLGQALPSNNTQTTTVAGDFVLYSGDQIVLFYGSNSWSYTRLGRLDDPSGLREALGSGDVEITFQLAGIEEDPGPFDLTAGRVILNSGYEMPINGLGTYSLHGDECVNAVKSALSSGVRLIDTASAYGNEAEVGQAIREAMEELDIKREDIFVITKIYPGSEMANPEASIQGCIDRLDIGYVDMMLLHHPDANDVTAYKAMERFVADGKIRSLGLSNWYVEELENFLPQVTIKPALVQNEIHPYYQENDVIPYIQEQGIAVQGWYPLGGRGHTAQLLGDPVISKIAQAHGKSSAQVILRWNLQKGVVVIPGSSNPDHIKENAELYDFTLTDSEMAQINALDRNEKHDWY